MYRIISNVTNFSFSHYFSNLIPFIYPPCSTTLAATLFGMVSDILILLLTSEQNQGGFYFRFVINALYQIKEVLFS